MLTPQEAERSRPKIDLRIFDQRRSKTPLPALVFTGSAVNVIYQAVDLGTDH